MHTAVNPLHNLARRFVALAMLWLVLASLAACGGGGGSDGGTAALNPPVASDGAVTTLEDSTVNATLNASDPSGLTLTFRVITNPGKGTVVVNATTGSFAYTPDQNANGGDSFTFVANNGGSDSNVATITITITPVSDDPPVAVNDIYTVPGSGLSLTISAPSCSDPDSNKRGVLCNDTDPDGPTTLTVATADRGTRTLAHGSLTLNADGSFTYTHNGDTSTSDSFTYRANDGSFNSAPATVTLSINQPPAANNACVTTSINTPISGALSATDPEGQAVTYALGAGGGKGSVNIDANGNYSYTPSNSSFRGMDKFTYQVTDSLGQSSTGTITVLIDSVTPGRVRIMPLGDSITAGYPGDGSTEPFWVGYRRKLYNDLTALNPTKFGVDFVGSVTTTGASANPPLADRDHEGHGGWCDDAPCSGGFGNIADSVTGFLNSNPPDVILLHIGTNDFNTSSAGVNTILNNISTWAQSNYPVTVFVARIIPSVDGSLNVNLFNNNVEAIATDRTDVKVYMVGQQGVLQLPGKPNNADPSLMEGNLHPNQTGYDVMADKWNLDMLGTGALPTCP